MHPWPTHPCAAHAPTPGTGTAPLPSDQEVKLAVFLQVDHMYPLCFNGATLFHVGTCRAWGSLPLSLTLFPVQPGLQNLNGLQLRDMTEGRAEKVYSFNNLCTVFVEH